MNNYDVDIYKINRLPNYYNRNNYEINRLNQKRKTKKSNLTGYFVFIIMLLMLSIGAIGLTIFVLGSDQKAPLLQSRTYASVEKMQVKLSEDDQMGVGGAYLPESKTTPLSTLDYYIKRGDSIHSIARRFGIDEATIIKLNDIKIPSKIVRGQKILIPNQNGIQEEVTRRNSLDKIAKKYDMDKEELMRVNNLVSEHDADKIFIPGMKYDGVSKQLLLGEYFTRPIRGGRFTSMFGYRVDPFTKKKSCHTGVDIAHRMGTKVYAAAPGKVIFAGTGNDYGNFIRIQHTSGYVSYYAHLSKINVKKGDWVSTGTFIGLVGSTGRSTGPHLHYEIRKDNVRINPMTVTVF